MRNGIPRLALMAMALAAALAAYWSARLSYAALLYDRATPRTTQRSAALAPGNARYAMGWAQLAEAAGLGPAAAESLLHSVLRAHPGDSEALIALGLRAEMRNDFASAERDLLEASRGDRGYNPRWALANYYFRRHDGPNFWKWARAASAMTSEPTPLFNLLWNYTGDGAEILHRAIPDQPALLRQYLYFLISGPHWDAAASTASRILQRPQPDDTPALMAWCDRLLAAARGPQALALWNALARQNLIEFAPLDPARGPVNPAFETAPTGAGFDWHLAPAPGIEPSLDRPGLRLNFTGEEPEAWEPLWQYAPLEPSSSYRLTFQYATTAIAPASGLRWRVVDLTAQPAVLAQSESLSHQDWQTDSVLFQTPPPLRLARIDLSYRRTPGTVRIEGSIRLRNVTLERVH